LWGFGLVWVRNLCAFGRFLVRLAGLFGFWAVWLFGVGFLNLRRLFLISACPFPPFRYTRRVSAAMCGIAQFRVQVAGFEIFTLPHPVSGVVFRLYLAKVGDFLLFLPDFSYKIPPFCLYKCTPALDKSLFTAILLTEDLPGCFNRTGSCVSCPLQYSGDWEANPPFFMLWKPFPLYWGIFLGVFPPSVCRYFGFFYSCSELGCRVWKTTLA